MSKALLVIFSLFAFFSGTAQSRYEPQILILPPNTNVYDAFFDQEIKDNNKEIQDIAKKKSLLGREDRSKLSENLIEMANAESEFIKGIDFSKQIALYSEQYLTYRFFERFPNLLILLKDTKCDSEISELRKLSGDNGLQYVLNYPKIEFYKRDGVSYAKLRVQLYDKVKNAVLIDKEYLGDWHNPGFEFCCQDSTLQCTVNNALSDALSDVIEVIAENSPTLQGERKLAEDRSVILFHKLTDVYDKDFLYTTISIHDSSIDLSSMFQCLIDSTKTKFVAFYRNKVIKRV